MILDFQDTIATLNIICRLHLSFFELCQEFIHRSDLIWKICRTHTDFFRHMTVAGTKCKISILPCICRRFHTCCKRCTSIEYFHTVQAAHHSQILLQATVIIAKWMRCETNASLCFYKIYKILCRDPLFWVIFNSKCDNVSLKRIKPGSLSSLYILLHSP